MDRVSGQIRTMVSSALRIGRGDWHWTGWQYSLERSARGWLIERERNKRLRAQIHGVLDMIEESTCAIADIQDELAGIVGRKGWRNG